MTTEAVRRHYQKNPYPPCSPLALPKRGEGRRIAFDEVAQKHHRGIDILVAGCGTFESVVIGQVHPFAGSLTAIDLSDTSVKIAKNRYLLAKILGRRLPPATFRVTNLNGVEGKFDYITASNVLHHLADPLAGMKNLARALKPGGLIRIVIYAKYSRQIMRDTQDYFRECGLQTDTPRLGQSCLVSIRKLPESDPRRILFESHAETAHPAGLRDAFFHPLENPPSMLEWEKVAPALGLKWTAETTAPSPYIERDTPKPWMALHQMDLDKKLARNPVIWLTKHEIPQKKQTL